MIKTLLITLSLLLAPLAYGQDNVFYPQVYTNGGQIVAAVASTGACPPGSCIGITIPTTVTTITVGVLGTFSATLQPEESQNGGYTWTSAGTAITAPGTSVYTVTAFTNFRVRASAYVSGVANVNIQAGPTGGSGSAGAGVTSLNGLVGGVTLAAGSGVTIIPSGNTLTIASSGGGGSPGGAAGDDQFNNGAGGFTNANGIAAGSTANLSAAGTYQLLTFAGITLNSDLGGGSTGIDIDSSSGSGNITISAGGNSLTIHSSELNFAGGGPELDIGKNGTVSGILGLRGATSGTATFTAPAVAGTSTNAIVSSNNLSAPAFVSTVAIGTPPLTVTSTTNVPNLNASSLGGATFAAPGAIGGTTPGAGTFTTLTGTSYTCGITGTTSCVITGSGSTSGTATITWPAVAGTTTNPLTFSNNVVVGNGAVATPGYAFASGANYGFWLAANQVNTSIAGVATQTLGAALSTVSSGVVIGFSSTAASTGAADTGISRVSAGVLGVGTGAAASVAGSLTGATLTGRTALTAGVVGTTAGLLNLSGATSGTATFTAPAVAGTTTNPVISSNAITIPLGPVTATIASGTSAMGTGAITSGTCATVVTTAAAGVATTDAIQSSPNTDPTAVTGYAPSATGSLYIWAYPTSGNVNFRVCNNTVSSITPSALTLNWRVTR